MADFGSKGSSTTTPPAQPRQGGVPASGQAEESPRGNVHYGMPGPGQGCSRQGLR